MSAWLDLAVVAALTALSFLVVRMRRELRECSQLVSQAIDFLPMAPTETPDEPAMWPDDAVLQPGSPAPQELSDHDGWTLAIFGRGSDDVRRALPPPEDLDPLLARYRVVAVTTDSSFDDLHPDGVSIVEPSEFVVDELPLPAAAMVDPAGVVQGVSAVANGSEVLVFVAEGEHQGFGPARTNGRA